MSKKTKTMKTAALILDFDLYPRRDIDSQHVTYIAVTMEAGTEMPPVIVDSNSMRVVDGFHRIRAAEKLYGTDATIEAVLKTYNTDADLFREAMRLNATHGRVLTQFDKTHCALRAADLKISIKEVAADLGMTVDKISVLVEDRTGEILDKVSVSVVDAPRQLRPVGYKKIGKKRLQIPLKNTIRHMSGKTLTKKQLDVNDKLSGMNPSFYANQLILLLEADLIPWDNNKLVACLVKLQGALAIELKGQKAA